MNKEESLEQFLKSLRIALNYISLYSRSHRAFLASVGILKEKLASLLNCLEPVEIGFTPDSLIIDGQIYAKIAMHRELARIFHSRKIKSVRFTRGITEQELALVLDRISLPVKEILAGGGLATLLEASAVPHFSQEELDYSQLLKDEGDEGSDIWSYLLNDVLEEKDCRKIDDFLETFETMVGRMRGKHLLDDQKLRDNVGKLLTYIKGKDAEQYFRCAKQLLRALIKDKTVSADGSIGELKGWFSELDSEQLSLVLWEGISDDDTFDNRSLELFSQLVGQDKHEKIADELVKRAGREKNRNVDPAQLKRIKNMFSFTDEPSYIPQSYRKAIAAISEQQYFNRGFSFQRPLLQSNFDFILLNLLALENSDAQRELIFSRIAASWEQLVTRADTRYMRALKDIVALIPPGSTGATGEVRRDFLSFIERGSWSPQFPEELQAMCLSMTESSLDPETYMRRIFGTEACQPCVIRLYFRFFGSQGDAFFSKMAARAADFEFISAMITCLKDAGGGEAEKMLTRLFFVANDLVKVEIARALWEMGSGREFLVSVLPGGSSFVKKELLALLMAEREPLDKALDSLFRVSNQWGRNNEFLQENMQIVEEIDCRAARPYLQELSRGNFIFFSGLAASAKKILGKWDA